MLPWHQKKETQLILAEKTSKKVLDNVIASVFLKFAIPLGWILILLLFVTHISIILGNVQALYNNRAVTILIYRWSSSV